MRILIDTQIYIWAVIDSDHLSEHARQIMLDATEVFVSSASIWEIAIKAKLGKLEGDPHAFATAIVESGFRELVISARHACRVYELPLYHRSPFDRLLVAQALSEPFRFLTADKQLAQYSELIMLVS